MSNLARVVCALLLLTAGPWCRAENAIPLVIPPPGAMEPAATATYYEKLLLLALNKSARTTEADQATYKITYYNRVVGRERYRVLLKQGNVDIIWSSSNKAREADLIPVKFNLLRGINEYRVLLIRADDQPRFNGVKSLTDLRQFKVGSGTHWSDTQVYKFNGLPVVTTSSFDAMFRMLAAKRFDYMARSLQEIDHELEQYRDLGLIAEKNLLIHYPQPIYFFLNKNHAALAQRIERGLLMAQDDGSLDTLFQSFPNFRAAEEKIRHIDRRIIELRRED